MKPRPVGEEVCESVCAYVCVYPTDPEAVYSLRKEDILHMPIRGQSLRRSLIQVAQHFWPSLPAASPRRADDRQGDDITPRVK